MQRESVNQKRGVSARNWIVWLAVLIAAPATLLVAWRFGNRKYYLSSLLLIVYAMLPFFVRFEHKKPQARELVTIAVMSAVAVASRAAFIMVPFFKPLTGIVMIAGMALGPGGRLSDRGHQRFCEQLYLRAGAVDAVADVRLWRGRFPCRCARKEGVAYSGKAASGRPFWRSYGAPFRSGRSWTHAHCLR